MREEHLNKFEIYDDEEDSSSRTRIEESDSNSNNGTNLKTEIKKSNKPIMEKRRRARINNCLNELKGILLEAMRKDPARHSKLEKADILELTVRHLQNIQRNQLAVAMASDPTVLHRFKNGFSECATEVSRYMSRMEINDNGIKSRVSSHLTSCVNGLQQASIVNPMLNLAQPQIQPQPQILAQPPFPLPNDLNNNNNTRFQTTTHIIPPQTQTAQNSSISIQTKINPPKNFNFSTHSVSGLLKSPPSPPPLSAFSKIYKKEESSPENLNYSMHSRSSESSLGLTPPSGLSSPIDFSTKSNTRVRVVKVDPFRGSSSEGEGKGSMWRPW